MTQSLNKFNIFQKPSEEIQNKITLWLNHLLVIYAFLIPIHNGAKSSLFFTMLILFLYRRNYWLYLKEALNNKIVQAFLLFYLVNLLGLLYTDNMEYGMSHMDKAKYLLFPLILLSFLDVRFSFRIIGAFILGMLVAEVFSYLIHFQIFPYEFSIGKYNIWETKAYSPAPFMAHSDHGVGISIVVGLSLYYLLNFHDEEKYKKIIAFTILLVSLINISFIASRTGYVTFAAIIFITVLITYKKNIKLLFISTLIFFISCFSIYSFSDTVNERVKQAITSFEEAIETEKYYENGSTAQRIGLTIYGYKVVKDNLFFGVGTGDHMDLLRERIPKEQENLKVIAKPHNVYIQIPMQIGIIGLASFIFLIYSLFYYKNISREKKDIIIIITVATLTFMGGGMFFGTFELPLFVVFISAMIAQKIQNIELQQYNYKLYFIYLIIIILFLVIGITR